jgi:AcrR family transcriptional regulator
VTPRAVPLPPQERREAILEAVLPLVLERGLAVTTKELAHASGVAEGTLFRVFESKDELVLAAARSVFGRSDLLGELAAVDPALPLEQRLIQVVQIWQRVVGRIVRVYVVMSGSGDRHRLGDPRATVDRTVVARAEAIVAELLRPDADRLRMPVNEVIRVLGSLVMVSVHPMEMGVPLTPEGLVDLLLHGVLAPAAPSPPSTLTLTLGEDAYSTTRHTSTEGPACSGD